MLKCCRENRSQSHSQIVNLVSDGVLLPFQHSSSFEEGLHQRQQCTNPTVKSDVHKPTFVYHIKSFLKKTDLHTHLSFKQNVSFFLVCFFEKKTWETV